MKQPTTFQNLLCYSDVIIPIIQRDYAQGRKSDKIEKIRTEFLKALHKATTKEDEELVLDFIYGVITAKKKVSEKQAQFIITPLDGQQRLTTLFLLHWYAKNMLRQESCAELDLTRFTYKTHPATRQFCQKLATWDKEIIKSSSISLFIKKRVSWWIAEWGDDPTIDGMLTMLDAIHDMFKDVPSIFLDNVKFYLYPLVKTEPTSSEAICDNDELTEDIYIKMNARGLELTPFAKVKGHILEEMPQDIKDTIASSFDKKWTDIMWEQVSEKGTNAGEMMDGYFIRFIRFVCDTFLRNNEFTNDFDMIDAVIKHKSFVNGNEFTFATYLIEAFECLKKYIDDKYLTTEDAPNPTLNLKVSKDDDLLFRRCLKGYTPPSDSENTSRNFTTAQTLLLYAFLVGHIAKIKESQLHERLRHVRNLIWNNQSTKLSDLLDDTEAIICSERLPDTVKAFSQEQLEEERKKANHCEEWRRTGKPNMISALYQLEDHDFLHGKIGLFGDCEDLGVSYKDAFFTLYSWTNEDRERRIIQISRALVHNEEYPHEPYIFKSTDAWRNMYHKVAGFYEYHKSVLNLLETLHKRGATKESVSDKLEEIIEEKIKEHIDDESFDWRYYFAKYDMHGNYCINGEFRRSKKTLI